MIIHNYDGRGNTYDTEDPTTGPYISLFTIYGEPNRAAYERIKGTKYTITDGREVVTMTPAEAFAILNGAQRQNPSAANTAYRALALSKEDYKRAAKEPNDERNGERMKHDKTAGYFEDLKSAYNSARAAYEELTATQKQENEQYNGYVKDHNAGRMNDRDFTIATASHITVEDTIKHSLASTRNALEEGAAAIRAELAAFLAEKYRPTGASLDNDTINLLNAGILTIDELAETAERYKDNATMKRVIAKHADELAQKGNPDGDEAKKARALYYNLTANNDGSAELDAFDRLAEWAGRGVDDNGEYTTGVFNNQFPGAYAATLEALEK